MSEKFDLERRAAELLSKHHYFSGGVAIAKALQLASELAEAIAAEIEERNGRCFESAIARYFARPRTREDVYREALVDVYNSGASAVAAEIARRALDEGAKEQP